jgi:hypothetical protein
MPLHNSVISDQEEVQIRLAIQALKKDATPTISRVVIEYKVPERTLRRRRAGTVYRRDCTPTSLKLLKKEDNLVVNHIPELVARRLPPCLAAFKIWVIFCWLPAGATLSARTGLQLLSDAALKSKSSSIESKATRELYAKILPDI